MGQILETLRAARRTIRKPENWCKGAGARNAAGVSVFSTDPGAKSFCSYGAIWRASNSAFRISEKAHAVLSSVVKCGSGIRYNDAPRRRHSEVLKAFDRAIAKAKREGL